MTVNTYELTDMVVEVLITEMLNSSFEAEELGYEKTAFVFNRCAYDLHVQHGVEPNWRPARETEFLFDPADEN